ncbi:MAG: hypothetical protein ABR66_02200 [Microbacteriaceae bacterium BACL25 MAG-120322-bin65]|nr:MAG: hypothetical protein ABR66_02200 [Microbacteriaceae bacterium BACL25 MAG-120322-bin65]
MVGSGTGLKISFGTEFALSALISPLGAGLRSLSLGSEIVVPDYPGEERPLHAGAVLFPWAGRLPDGIWDDRGVIRVFPLNDLSTHSAIHGLVCDEPFEVVKHTNESVTLSYLLGASESYPHSLRLTVGYELGETGLVVHDEVINEGKTSAPFALAHHPYLSVGDYLWEDIRVEALLTHAAASSERLVPTSIEALPSSAAQSVSNIAPEAMDQSYRLTVRDGEHSHYRLITPGRVVDMWQDDHWPWLHVYGTNTLPTDKGGSKAVALEPHTSLPNSLNWPQTLAVLEAGEMWRGSWGISPPTKGPGERESL